MRKLFFIISLFFAVSCIGQVPSIGAFQIPGIQQGSSMNIYIKCVSENGIAFGSPDFGYSWPSYFLTSGYVRGAAISNTGQYHVSVSFNQASGIYTSNDYGLNFTYYSLSKTWFNTAISYNGQYMLAAASNGLYRSNDYGETWSTITTLNRLGCDINYTGQYQTSVRYGNAIYVSNDYGVTWTTAFTNSLVGDQVSVSGNGQYQLVNSRTGSYHIFLSDNYGISFSQIDDIPSYIKDVATNESGNIMMAVSELNIYRSNDYGASWSIVSSMSGSATVKNIDISGTGQYQILATEDGLFVSNDYGESWSEIFPTPYPATKDWRDVGIAQY